MVNIWKYLWVRIIVYILVFIIFSAGTFVGLTAYFIKNLSKQEQVKILLYSKDLEFNLNNKVNNYSIMNIVQSKRNPFLGNKDAKVVIVEYADFQCRFCKQFFPIIRRLTVEYKDKIRFEFRDFPILGDNSVFLAESGKCVNEQGKFFEFHDKIYTSKNKVTKENLFYILNSIGVNIEKFNDCMQNRRYKKLVEDDLESGFRAGVKGTPTIFINGNKLDGVVPYSVLKKVVDRFIELNNK